MTSDINVTAATVVAIQGESINSAAPNDQDTLIWDAADGYWKPAPIPTTGLRKTSFTSSGTWTCPAGVTNILVIGAGGGGGGVNTIGGTAGAGGAGGSGYLYIIY